MQYTEELYTAMLTLANKQRELNQTQDQVGRLTLELCHAHESLVQLEVETKKALADLATHFKQG